MINEIKEKTNLEIRNKTNSNLKGLLKNYSKDCLCDFYYNLTNEEVKGTKNEIIDMIYNYLLNEKLISRVLNSLSSSEYEQFMNIVNNGVVQINETTYNDYIFIEHYGIAYNINCNDKSCVVIPDEIIDIIKGIDTAKYADIALENDKIIDLAYAMCNLYGAAPIDIFIEGCKKFYGISNVNLDCVLFAERNNSIRLIDSENNFYLVKDEFTDLYNFNNILKIIEDMEDVLCSFDFKEISYENVINYRNLFYYEKNSDTEKFIEYFKKMGLNDEDANGLVSTIIESFRINYNCANSLLSTILSEDDIILDENNYDEFMMYLGNVVNSIPLWGNKGWTNKELILEEFRK